MCVGDLDDGHSLDLRPVKATVQLRRWWFVSWSDDETERVNQVEADIASPVTGKFVRPSKHHVFKRIDGLKLLQSLPDSLSARVAVLLVQCNPLLNSLATLSVMLDLGHPPGWRAVPRSQPRRVVTLGASQTGGAVPTGMRLRLRGVCRLLVLTGRGVIDQPSQRRIVTGHGVLREFPNHVIGRVHQDAGIGGG